MLRIASAIAVALLMSGCNMFSAPKIKEEAIVAPDTLYKQALAEMDAQRYMTSIETLKKLERQHPYSEYNERAKLMQVYANYRIGKFPDAISAADRYIALYPASKEMPYVLYLKGTSYFGQIKDATRDQALSRDAIDTYTLLINNYPKSDYAKDARDKMNVSFDQLAAKEMSVGRYYLGNSQYVAAINRFKVVAERYQTSTHIEEALYRLTEANLALGLVNEAQNAAAILGYNYPSSSWYKEAYELLKKQGVGPKAMSGSSLKTSLRS